MVAVRARTLYRSAIRRHAVLSLLLRYRCTDTFGRSAPASVLRIPERVFDVAGRIFGKDQA